MIDRKYCDHPVVSFQSGDYYVFCRVCDARWGAIKTGQDEYGTDATGKSIGCAPEVANIGPPICDQIRVKPKP